MPMQAAAVDMSARSQRSRLRVLSPLPVTQSLAISVGERPMSPARSGMASRPGLRRQRESRKELVRFQALAHGLADCQPAVEQPSTCSRGCGSWSAYDANCDRPFGSMHGNEPQQLNRVRYKPKSMGYNKIPRRSLWIPH